MTQHEHAASMAHLFLLLAIFVSSGVMQPLLISELGYNGAYDRSTLLFLLPNYVGMSFAGLLRANVFSTGIFRWRQLVVLCAVDVFSQFLCQYGLSVAGSSLYIIMYSSSVVWIAILSRLVLGRKLAPTQWLGCCVVVGGLAITGGNLAVSLSGTSHLDIAVGGLMILLGSASHAFTWVLCEQVLKQPNPVLPEALSAFMGFAGVATFSSWQLVYTWPRADELISKPIASHGGHTLAIAAAYVILTVASLAHAVTFYHLVGQMGCVTAGVSKGTQAVAVFVFSHVLYCGAQESQCMGRCDEPASSFASLCLLS